ncbi:MAG: diol dehydratase reactivase ATPase-like domain-containing protein [Parachlamydiaceae bacterium]|nr:diol dehydratase reactivase ATPase-like domain-containing protein [Parachlamydiaceae bacterium]
MRLKRQSLTLLIVLLGILLMIIWIPTNKAIVSPGEVRAAMDIGSGATNIIVAKVDPKTDKIIAKIYSKSIAVPYQKHLESSTDNTFDQIVMDQGIEAIKALKQVANDYQAKKVIAVATAAFRQAANAEQFAKKIEAETGVQVRIINQDEEGILAFRGALALTTANPENTIVWDIGGGSMQLTSLSKEGTYLVEKGKTASIPFKNAVITQIKHQDIQSVQTPNPMTKEEMQSAVKLASTKAKETDQAIITKLNDPQTTVLSVGNLFNYGVKPIVDNKVIKIDALENGVFALAGKTDEQLGKGSLSEVAVTNPLLVLGYMKGLNIHQTEVVDVNNADGALTYPAYWN